jgi:hypothetical protein
VSGPTVDGPASEPRGRWPHRVADLGPFTLVDAAATASAESGRIALTLVNRGLEAEPADIVLRDTSSGSTVFDGVAEITTVTAERGPGARVLPDVEGACVTEGSEKPAGSLLSLTLPPQSFTVIEAATTRS